MHNENALICFPLVISTWLTGSCLLLSAIPGSLSIRSIWLRLFSFLSTSLSLSLSVFPRQTFFYSACSWPLFVQSFLPHPHLLLFLSSACSSLVPLSSLCTAVECIWVLVGSPARTASQIPGLAALHPGCRTHATRNHRQKGRVMTCSTSENHQEALFFSVRELLRIIIRLAYVAEKSTWKLWNLYLNTRLCMFDGHFCSTVFDEERQKLLRQQMLKCFCL